MASGKMQKFAVIVAKKQSPSEAEMAQLWRPVSAYRGRVEDRVRHRIPMTMQSLGTRLNRFIEACGREVLQDAGNAMAETAKTRTEREFPIYRTVRDRLFESDLDLMAQPTEVRRTTGRPE